MERDLIIFLEAQGGQGPGWVRLLPLGEIALGDGREPFSVEYADLEAMAKHFQDRGLDLVIDYEHQTLSGRKAPAAGWIKELAVREDGLWARVEWTAAARRHLEAKEYRYFSPVLRLDQESRRPVALLHVALTNTPAINHLPPLVAKESGQGPGARGQQRTDPGGAAEGGAQSMWGVQCECRDMGLKITDPKEEDLEELWEQLKNILGLKMEATGEEVLALAGQRLSAITAFAEVAVLLDLPDNASATQIKGAILALKGGLEQLSNRQREFTALKAELAEREVQDEVRKAIEARKIQPSQRECALRYARSDMEGFKTFVEKSMQGVPLEPLKEMLDPASTELQLTPQERAICEALGLAGEAFKAQEKQLQAQKIL